MQKEEMIFSVFLIHALAESWNKSCSYVYDILNESGILDDYIVKCYDVLHTLGKNYQVDDITGFVRDKGYKI